MRDHIGKGRSTRGSSARNEAKLAEVAAEIKTGGGTAEVFAIDIASEESIKAGAKAVIGHFGSIEILVNNAGITKDTLLLRMKRADWDDVITTNLTGTFLLTQALLSPMLKAAGGELRTSAVWWARRDRRGRRIMLPARQG